MDVNIVNIEFEEFANLQDLLTQTGHENEQLKSDIKLWIELKNNMVGKLTKAEGDNKNMAKEINDMRLVINTTDKEELMKIIEEQKRKMCNMEEENINIFNENTYFKEESQKAFQNRKYLEIVFQITINDLNQIILKKDEEIQNLLTTIALETRTETSPGTSLEAPPGTSPGTASGTTPETAPHIAPPSENPLWRPFEDRAVVSPPALDSPPIQEVDECVQSVQCNGNCEHVVCHKVTCNDCKQNNQSLGRATKL